MNTLLVALFAWIFILTVVSLMTGDFLRHVENDNPEKFHEIWSDMQAFWNHLHPFRIAYMYVVPGTYKHWNLQAKGLRSARRLRIVAILSILILLTVCVLLFTENLM